MKPTPGRIAKPKRWLSVFATIVGVNLEMNGPAPPGNNVSFCGTPPPHLANAHAARGGSPIRYFIPSTHASC